MRKSHFKLPGVLFTAFIFMMLTGQKVMAQYNYSLAIPAQNASVQYDNSTLSYNDFYRDLAPYGKWIEDKQYGYVWSPDVDASFRPYYTNGHWAMTNYGNTWVSDYSWGWACFHYGRWTYDSFYGWLWVPGANWGPAWVCWREASGYYGWAPLSPGYDFSSKRDYTCPKDWWVFLPYKYIYSGSYYRYWSGPRNNKDLIHNSGLINNLSSGSQVSSVWGPNATQVETVTKKPVQVFKLVNSNNLNSKTHLDVIRMYRPTEIKPVAMLGGEKVSPPDVIKAPKDIAAKPQSLASSQDALPEFRKIAPKRGTGDAIGSHFPEPKTAPEQGNNDNPYKWDSK